MTPKYDFFTPVDQAEPIKPREKKYDFFTPAVSEQKPEIPEEKTLGTYLEKEFAPSEGILKTTGRYIGQAAKAAPLAIRGVPGLNFAISLLTGGKLNEEEIPEEYIRPQRGYMGEEPEQPKKEKKSPSEQAEFPLSRIYDYIEEQTGIPLKAKTSGQKLLSVVSDTVSMSPGTPQLRGLMGFTAGTIFTHAKDAGLNDNAAANLSLLATQSIAGAGKEYNFVKPQERPSESRALVPTQPASVSEAYTSMAKPEMGKYMLENLPEEPPPPTQRPEPPPVAPVQYPRPPAPPEMPVPEERAPVHEPVGFNQQIGRVFTNRPVLNDTRSGDYLVKTVADSERPVLTRINEAYDMAEYLRQGQQSEPVGLTRDILEERERIHHLPAGARTSVENKYLETTNDILNHMTQRDPEGNVQFVRPIEDDYFYNLRKNIHTLADYEFVNSSGKAPPTGAFKRLIAAIDNHLENSAQEAENPEAYEAVRYANHLYQKTWAEPYQNIKILPYRSTEKNIAHAKLYNDTSNIDTFRALSRVLTESQTPEARNMLQLMKRNTIQKQMQPFIENPRNVGSIDYNKQLNELNSILDPRELQNLNHLMITRRDEIGQEEIGRAREERRIRAQKAQHKEITRKLEAAEKEENRRLEAERKLEIDKEKKRFLEATEKHEITFDRLKYLRSLTPEKLVTHASTVSGLHEIRQWMARHENGAIAYDETRRMMAGHVLYQGKESDPSPSDILNVLNNKEKRRFLLETMGPDAVGLLQKTAKRLDAISKWSEEKKKILEKMKPKLTLRGKAWEKVKDPKFYLEESLHMMAHPELYPIKMFGSFWKGVSSIRERNKENQLILDALEELESQVDEHRF